jgi:aminopeptidase N
MIRQLKATILALVCAVTVAACGRPSLPAEQPVEIRQPASQVTVEADRFSHANYNSVRVTHVDLDLDVNFDTKTLVGMATLDFDRINPEATQLVLDTKDLVIKSVTLLGDTPFAADYEQGDYEALMGSKLTVEIGDTASQVQIEYETSPEAEGLQWLSPEQTAGKVHPYLFSQAQATNARTIAPLQDTPAVRITYSAKLRVPDDLLALMSAEQNGQDETGAYNFNMPQPIPSYLIAVAVGDIKFKAINDHIGVYAEEYILDAAAEEFSETPLMEASNEKFYGPYRWGRYDLIVLPPSFPYGGMENPRLSFMTPTLIAGDKSLTNVVAHELAHSWSGNLVTNATWRDAWLNEGVTSYVENRVMEDLYGEGRAVMEQALALDDLKRAIAEAKRPELTQLKLPDTMEHPDDAFTNVAYVKGQFFLIFLEERFGREAFDTFLKGYFDHFAFQSITTEDFIAYLHTELHENNPDALTKEELQEWVYQPGLPSTAKAPQSDAFDKVDDVREAWITGKTPAADLLTDAWTTHEWLYFLGSLPETMTVEQMDELDAAFGLTGTRNAETAFAWYMNTIPNRYSAADDALETFLMTVGRGKFIYRLYGSLAENGKGEWAREVYAKARPGYHPIAQRRIDDILKEN